MQQSPTKTICITVTIGELSRTLKSDARFGLYIRGWTSEGLLRDEPEANDEPVLTVRLTVDATLEPTWELICDRSSDPRTLSNRDRALFGLVRLAGDDARHLTWGQGSVLSKLTGENDEATASLAQAYKAARSSAGLDRIAALTGASATAESYAKSMGAYVDGAYRPDLELGRGGISTNSIALHDGGVPLRLAGLGTRRLATLAIQKSAIAEGGIVLVDEIEHGLEPHRILGAVSQLKTVQHSAATESRPIGQVIMTTHSDVALGEVGSTGLYVSQMNKADHRVNLVSPKSPNPIRAILRHYPRSLFGRRILICEGMTEVGLLLGLREFWVSKHGNKSIEQLGSVIVDGNGDEAPGRAMALSELGYVVAIYRDSDKPLSAPDASKLATSAIDVFEYDGTLNTEHAIFGHASDLRVQQILEFVRSDRDATSVNDSLLPKIPGSTLAVVNGNFSTWSAATGVNPDVLRRYLSEVALKNKWFKDARVAREVAPIIWSIAQDDLSKPMAKVLSKIEEWLYA